MRIGAVIQWLVGGLVAGAMLYTGAHGYFSAARRQVESMRAGEGSRASQEGSRKAQEREQEATRILAQHKQQLEKRWQAALGGPVAMASRDPSLSIGAMIAATAKACAGPESKVTVHVERFTDFTLGIDVSTNATRIDAAAPAACLLPFCGQYLHRVRFSSRGEILAELGPEVLARVKNWKGLKPHTVSAMFDAPRPEVRLAQVVAVPEAMTELSSEEQKLQSAEEVFYERFAEHFTVCRELIRKQDAAINLADVRSESELEMRIKGLEESEPPLKLAHGFFEKPDADYERILRKAGFDSLVVQVTTRGYMDANRMQNAHLLFIFDKLLERQAATKKLLETMRKGFGHWSPAPDGRVQFQEAQLQQSYQSVLEEYTSATHVLDQALKTMPSKGR